MNEKQSGDGLTSLKKYSQEELNEAYEQGKRDGVEKILHRLKILWRSHYDNGKGKTRQTFTLPADWETYLRNIGADK